MKAHLTIILFLTFAVRGPANAATGKAPAEFRGIKWGGTTTNNKTIKRLSGPTGADKLEVWTATTKQPALFLGIPVAEEAYLLTRGKLFSGQLFIDTEANFGKVKDELTKLYGKPDFANESLKLYKWKWPSEKFEISISYQAKFKRTTVTFTNDRI
ncbi:MAG: hypothetical protein HY648_14165 [Acidobacteria bacterium]|nr:hypothetical protein [Acidobacteriota bacterium]